MKGFKQTYMKKGFLHRHPTMETGLGLDKDHVIVDLNDWIEAQDQLDVLMNPDNPLQFVKPVPRVALEDFLTLSDEESNFIEMAHKELNKLPREHINSVLRIFIHNVQEQRANQLKVILMAHQEQMEEAESTMRLAEDLKNDIDNLISTF